MKGDVPSGARSRRWPVSETGDGVGHPLATSAMAPLDAARRRRTHPPVGPLASAAFTRAIGARSPVIRSSLIVPGVRPGHPDRAA